MTVARAGRRPLIMQALLVAERWAVSTALAASVLALAAMACVSLWQVVARFALERPQAWSEVLARTLMIWAAFLALGGAYRRGLMVTVDFVHRLAPAGLRRLLEWSVLIANAGILSLVLWNGIRMTARVAGQTVAGLGISIAWCYAAIPAGCAVALLAVLARFVGDSSPVDSTEAW